MTISNQRVKDVYVADGSNRNWEWSFPVLSTDDIKIKTVSTEGAEEDVNTAYKLNTINKIVIYPTEESELAPLAKGTKVVLYRQTPITQDIDLRRNGTLDAETLEKGYDKRTLVEQELSEQLDRAFKFSVADARKMNATEYLNTVTTAAQNAAQSASSAKVSEGNAKNSEVLATMAADEATQKAEQAVLAAETATAKANAAAKSEASAKISAESAAESKSAAQISADLANASALLASEKEALAGEYATTAQKAADKAENAQLIAEDAALRAEEAAQSVSRVMEYKGSVATFEDLPFDSQVGDVWNVSDTGANYAWDGTKWDKFSEIVDLSAYQTKEEAETALAEKQDILEPGKGVKIEGNVISVENEDENAYTKENLIGGKGVEIVPESTGGGQDEHTIALWHFDENATDVIKGVSLTYNTQINQNGKFGGCVNYYSNGSINTISQLNIVPKQSWTMDYWLKYQTYQSSGQGAYGLGQENNSSNNFLGIGFYRYELRLIGNGWGDNNGTAVKTFDGTITGTWHHLAVQYEYDEEQCIGSVFVDGEPVYEGPVTLSDSLNFNYMGLTMGPQVYFDELRISDTLRYSGKFTPPTEPYSEPVLTGRNTIEAKGKADTDLGNIPTNYDYVYRTFNQEAGTTSAGSWYRIYRSGWIEQGGTTGNVADTETITFLQPFARVPFIYCFHIASDSYVKGVNVTSASDTSFTFKKTTEGGSLVKNRINWFACGQGAEL